VKSFGVVIFPGSNCDLDALHVVENGIHQKAIPLWHKNDTIPDLDCIILPGGFSYGDYLRPGAIASHSPIMRSIKQFADQGGLVIGICNGFQVLVESNLLPGVLLRNDTTRFISRLVTMRVENTQTPFTRLFQKNQMIKLPIAHKDGNFFLPGDEIKNLVKNNQIIFTYENNPNGSAENIAGICNEKGNVLGLMPHPERAFEKILGSDDGLTLFQSILSSLEGRK